MRYFGRFNGDFLQGVFEVETEEGLPEGVIELENWMGWPPDRPFDKAKVILSSNGQWVWGDPRSIEEIRSDKIKELNSKRDSLINSSIEVDGKIFDADEKSKLTIQIAATSAMAARANNTPFTRTWILSNNTEAELSGEELISLLEAIENRNNETYNLIREKKNQVALATKEEIYSIDLE